MRYFISLRLTEYYDVEFDAQSEEEAQEKAHEMWLAGLLDPSDSELEVYDVVEIPRKPMQEWPEMA